MHLGAEQSRQIALAPTPCGIPHLVVLMVQHGDEEHDTARDQCREQHETDNQPGGVFEAEQMKCGHHGAIPPPLR